MILFQQARKLLFITISVVLLFLTATAFGFIGNDRSTLTLSMSSVNLPVNQIAMGEEKTEASDKNLEGKTESQMEESQKFDTETQDGISNAIQNPDYKPSGKTKGAEKEDRQATKDIKAEASDAMLSTK